MGNCLPEGGHCMATDGMMQSTRPVMSSTSQKQILLCAFLSWQKQGFLSGASAQHSWMRVFLHLMANAYGEPQPFTASLLIRFIQAKRLPTGDTTALSQARDANAPPAQKKIAS